MTANSTKVKICGIKDTPNLHAAVDAGADYIGLVFYPSSPRHITPNAAHQLAREMPAQVTPVGLFVNPSDKDIRDALSQIKLGMIQLHGDETPLRVIEIKAAYKIPVMKAIRIGGENDLAQIEKYEKATDWLMFDTKSDIAPGGTGERFDWHLLQGRKIDKPWMLSGGLDHGNVVHALKILSPNAVDISSGVESSRGVKDPAKIRQFIEAVKKY